MVALYTLGSAAIVCAFFMGYLVRCATHRPPTEVMMPTRDAKGRFLPWKAPA